MDARGARVINTPIVGRENVEAALKQGPVKGAIRVDGSTGQVALVPPHMRVQSGGRWNPRMLKEAPIPAHVQEFMQAVPAEVRRSARERYRELVSQLVADGLRTKKLTGKVEFPASIEREIQTLAVAEGDPTLLTRIKNGSIEAIERYAAWQMRQVAAQQKAQDRKKVALDWHGHYSA